MILRILVLGFAVFLVSCQQGDQSNTSSHDVTKPYPTSVIEHAEKLAYDACICERKSHSSSGRNDDCWSRFREETKGIFDQGYGTASDPITTNVSCSSNTEQCIATDHELMLRDTRVALCTDQEVEVVNAAYEEVMEKKMAEGFDLNEADEFAQKAVREMVEPLKHGTPIALLPN